MVRLRHRLRVVEALALVLLARVLRRHVPMRRWAPLLGPSGPAATPPVLGRLSGTEARVAVALRSATARTGANCLEQAVAASLDDAGTTPPRHGRDRARRAPARGGAARLVRGPLGAGRDRGGRDGRLPPGIAVRTAILAAMSSPPLRRAYLRCRRGAVRRGPGAAQRGAWSTSVSTPSASGSGTCSPSRATWTSLVAMLTAEYDVSAEQCRTDVARFLEALEEHGLVVRG
ncbi:PqqD family protein [Nocardioides sp. W3-2-3]|uniref:PqqD family protein n=1 Tax=Nocardioides convexus TaxID=2712224 RepID=UPI0024186E9E|nr:PqqD family protein [Nocardioides convexus]NHA01547.1 PqqD family protein [Nocardioides convexus]